MIDSLFAKIDTIEKAQDPAFLSILFEKLILLLETVGLNNNYEYHDFNFKPKKKIDVDKQRFVISFPEGIIFVGYQQYSVQKFSVVLGINNNAHTDLSKLNWSIHSRKCSITVAVNNDLEYESMFIHNRLNFRLESINPFDDYVSCFDAEYHYDKNLNVKKKFKFREMERYDDISFIFELTLPPIFYTNNIQFENHFFSFMDAFEKNNPLLKELFPFIPDFSTILHDHSAFNDMCFTFAERYEDTRSDFFNNILVFEMSTFV